MSELRAEINTMQEKLNTFEKQINEQNEIIEGLRNEASDINSNHEKQRQEINSIKHENNKLRDSLHQAQYKSKVDTLLINNLEQYTRNNRIRIYGLPDNNKYESLTDSSSMVINTLNNKLNLKINSTDIDIAHRLGSFRQDGNRPIFL
ncbi:hypothetical protein ACF0H5_007986 [Mactra antiquata]